MLSVAIVFYMLKGLTIFDYKLALCRSLEGISSLLYRYLKFNICILFLFFCPGKSLHTYILQYKVSLLD